MSAYSKNSIENILKCSACSQKFTDYDEPKILPCGFTICSTCDLKIDHTFVTSDSRQFKCPILTCIYTEHTKPSPAGFPLNYSVIQLISLQPKEIYRSKEIEILKLNLNKLNKIVNEIEFNIENSNYKLNEYCNEFRTQIMLSTDKRIIEIQDISDSLIKRIDSYENECKKSFELMKSSASNTRMDEIKLFINETNSKIENIETRTEEIVKESIMNKSVEYIAELENESKLINDLILDSKVVEFEKDLKKLEKRLIGEISFETKNDLNKSIMFARKKLEGKQLS